ncbi:MAG: hypothetical protein WD851_00240 [Pirellulales bacterium]
MSRSLHNRELAPSRMQAVPPLASDGDTRDTRPKRKANRAQASALMWAG